MKSIITRKAARELLFAFAAFMALAACTNKQAATPASAGNEGSAEAALEVETTYLPAIDRYLADAIGSQYAEGEYCVPFHSIVGVDEQNTDDILVWGDFWAFNYNQVGDTLKCVSGGSHPGLMHIRQTEKGYEVTAFDQVEDGSSYLPTAKKIFGDKYDAFQAINSDEKGREKLRAEGLAEYVRKHGLTATMYQDYGWPAKKLK
ncbi:MAG: hypothetical protein K6B13_03530 [Prevotella sp.]|nr:hypothetical protein [Prevotella sp.]